MSGHVGFLLRPRHKLPVVVAYQLYRRQRGLPVAQSGAAWQTYEVPRVCNIASVALVVAADQRLRLNLAFLLRWKNS